MRETQKTQETAILLLRTAAVDQATALEGILKAIREATEQCVIKIPAADIRDAELRCQMVQTDLHKFKHALIAASI